MLPNVGTTGSNFEKLPVPKGWSPCFPTLEAQVPISRNGRLSKVGDGWSLCFPILKLQVPISRNCGFPRVGTPAPQPWNHGFPCPRTARLDRWNLCVRLNIDLCNSGLRFYLVGGNKMPLQLFCYMKKNDCFFCIFGNGKGFVERAAVVLLNEHPSQHPPNLHSTRHSSLPDFATALWTASTLHSTL